MIGRTKTGGGFWSVVNGLDGCAMVPFLALILGPTLVFGLFLWIIRDGLARAFNPAFTQWVIVGAFATILFLGAWVPFALFLAARAHAHRPPTPAMPPAPAVNVRMMGGALPEVTQQRPALSAPQSLPPGAIRVVLDDGGG
jgi:hypothetical protein